MAVGANARKFILVSEEGKSVHRRMLNTGTALSAGEMVTLYSNTLAEVTGTNIVGCAGICATDIAEDAYGTIYCSGMFKAAAETGVDFSLGDFVYNYDKTTLATGATDDIPVGKVVHTNPASGGTVYFELWSILLNEIDARA